MARNPTIRDEASPEGSELTNPALTAPDSHARSMACRAGNTLIDQADAPGTEPESPRQHWPGSTNCCITARQPGYRKGLAIKSGQDGNDKDKGRRPT